MSAAATNPTHCSNCVEGTLDFGKKNIRIDWELEKLIDILQYT